MRLLTEEEQRRLTDLIMSWVNSATPIPRSFFFILDALSQDTFLPAALVGVSINFKSRLKVKVVCFDNELNQVTENDFETIHVVLIKKKKIGEGWTRTCDNPAVPLWEISGNGKVTDRGMSVSYCVNKREKDMVFDYVASMRELTTPHLFPEKVTVSDRVEKLKSSTSAKSKSQQDLKMTHYEMDFFKKEKKPKASRTRSTRSNSPSTNISDYVHQYSYYKPGETTAMNIPTSPNSQTDTTPKRKRKSTQEINTNENTESGETLSPPTGTTTTTTTTTTNTMYNTEENQQNENKNKKNKKRKS
ncbi:hypothetical protein PPL_07864 [Heterostelium album PN500]|uniref:Uncharacterized protein n=1 Tax=Heterostelium pallidum (strain ATCC 26659 / Pp 5 / PN500) TaxID=670386 RepID=D3BH62_HETP5|nr:hypothetical protein PPL_07864 [Heterostelium album PN500]EFA79446.1 hypothetical protein PPL_07864 [Heterostelium album PN500]|eukprot:XP_020431567.1 hypothetical protein PPL_07864 [Heterostelium album PN500]